MVYNCSECNGSFKNAGEFCAHYNECHASKTSTNKVKSKKYQCNLYDYRSERNINVVRHMKLMHGGQEKNFRVDQTTHFYRENH